MENEAIIRLSVFLGLFTLFAVIEAVMPRRPRTQPRSRRWFTNWGIVILDTLTLRLLALALPLLAVGAALDAQANGWGLMHSLDIPLWLAVVATVLIFDLAIWAQHLVTHKVPLLWRLHRVHHADVDVDVTTAIRFHPVEIALSMAFKIGLVYAIGAPALAVILFEVVLNGASMFNHANLRLPRAVDRWLRLVIVTPDMHRVHHSVVREEHDTNYGFNLAIWDRIFGTYTPEPGGGQTGMTTGLAQWQDARPTRLLWSLALPFRRS